MLTSWGTSIHTFHVMCTAQYYTLKSLVCPYGGYAQLTLSYNPPPRNQFSLPVDDC